MSPPSGRPEIFPFPAFRENRLKRNQVKAMDREIIPAVAKDSFQEQTSVPADTLLRVAQPPEASLQGSVLMLIQFDVSEEIRLDELRNIFGARTVEASFKHPAPGYVRYQRAPVVEQIGRAHV